MAVRIQNINQKSEYKQTEIDLIPKDWIISTIGAEFEVQLGKMLDTEKNIGVPKLYIGNKAVQWNHINAIDLPKMSMSRSDLERFRLRHGDLLVCEGGEIGRAAIWEDPIEECYYQKALHRLRSLHKFNPHLMIAFLQFWTDHGKLSDYVTQTSIAHLTREKLINVPLPVPPLPEQQAIAAALSDVDALIASLDKLIAKKRNIKQATMQQLFTGKMRLPGFNEQWRINKVGELGKTYGGLTGKSKKHFIDGQYPYIPFLNIMNNPIINTSYLDYVNINPGESQNIVHKGDLLFNGSSETPEEVGMCSVLSENIPDLYLNSFCFGFRLSKELPSNGLYLSYFFRSNVGRQLFYSLAQGATRYNLSKRNFLQMEISYPGAEEQTAIAAILTDMDAEIVALEQRRHKTRMLKQGMMQELLTGRIRLV